MKNDKILLDHGSGGKIANQLIAEMMLPAFDNPFLAQGNDGAILNLPSGRLAFSTDSYVVDPIFFPGGNIGDLAVNGTVNDITMCGAVPKYLSAGFIIEEGFLIKDLEKIIFSMSLAAKKAGIYIVTGDTKVVPRGAADKIFINTAGIGVIADGVNISGNLARPGDQILLSGTIADHGVTILSQREGLSFDSPIKSDSAALNHMVHELIDAGIDIHVLRDPTRGGVGTTLNEIAAQSQIGIRISEEKIPVKKPVAGICALLGLDPLYVANEGKLLAFIKKDHAEKALLQMQKNPVGKDACNIGEVVSDHPGMVVMETPIGGERIVDMLTGEQLPRIC
jgi:hydrogenase expression/formation protein HypE